MKNETPKIAMYMAFGAILAIFILCMMGRVRTEMYEEGSVEDTEAELMNLLQELEQEAEGGEDEMMEGGEDEMME